MRARFGPLYATPGFGTFATNQRIMRTSFTLSLSLLTAALSAQIAIGPGDMPSVGDTVRYVNTAPDGIDVDFTGAGVTWDFSSLEVGAEGADTVVSVISTPFLYQFFFNNPLIYPDHDADIALRGPAFSFQALTVSNVYEYYKRDGSGYRNVGFGANVNGLPTSVRREPVDRVHVFPLEFGDTDVSPSSFTLDVPGLFNFTQDQVRTNTVDGWGTLYLPADTFEVLRVRSVLQREDSIYIAQFGQGFSFPEPETVEYKWIANGMDLPVLFVTTVGGQVTQARFHYSPSDLQNAVAERTARQVALFPNPANGTIWLHAPVGGPSLVQVIDAQGRTVVGDRRTSVEGKLAFDVSGLAPGRYQVIVTGKERQVLPLVVHP
jgi:hypothetical protein